MGRVQEAADAGRLAVVGRKLTWRALSTTVLVNNGERARKVSRGHRFGSNDMDIRSCASSSIESALAGHGISRLDEHGSYAKYGVPKRTGVLRNQGLIAMG
ncbi:hypothetical protein Trco_007996 [Trichoderma cornu-damae]|uniref:Uncharacterized protein n=1 Tax=Trichoderma cornu-damae TaxID=654480 RepID=A0A9P8QDR7_9HYPO|nr:hypothetical protein Trco_007996 [Trichoderma cornu-damae]